MKKIYFVLALSFFASFSFAQELLYFTNGNILKITNSSQSLDSLSFQIYNSSQNKDYSVNKNELVKMITESGEIVTFSGKYIGANNTNFSANSVSFNVIAIPAGRFTMAYQFLDKNGKVGYEIPVSFGLLTDGPTDPLPEIFDIELYSIFYSGFTLNLYPMGQRKVNYVLGPAIRFGVGKDVNYYCYDCGNDYNYDKQFFYTKFLINNGLVLTPTKHFSMSFIFSLGVMGRDNYEGEPTFGTTGDLQFNLTYQF